MAVEYSTACRARSAMWGITTAQYGTRNLNSSEHSFATEIFTRAATKGHWSHLKVSFPMLWTGYMCCFKYLRNGALYKKFKVICVTLTSTSFEWAPSQVPFHPFWRQKMHISKLTLHVVIAWCTRELFGARLLIVIVLQITIYFDTGQRYMS